MFGANISLSNLSLIIFFFVTIFVIHWKWIESRNHQIEAFTKRKKNKVERHEEKKKKSVK